jgi:hypothetical protein
MSGIRGLWSSLTLVFSLTAWAVPASSQVVARPSQLQGLIGRKIYPKDDSASVATFAAFKASLLAAAKRGDLATLKNAMAQEVQFERELQLTPDELIRTLDLREGTPWVDLERALRMGVAKEADADEETFIAPYIGAYVTEMDLSEMVVIGRNVNAREKPALTSMIVERLSYDIVEGGPESTVVTKSDPSTGWINIVTPSGKTAWVQDRYFDVGTYYRFQRIDGIWKLVSISGSD